MIVNSTSHDINLKVSVSRAISDKAGPELAVECAKLPNLDYGDIRTTKGYNMKSCKQIIHCNSHFGSKDKDVKVGLVI